MCDPCNIAQVAGLGPDMMGFIFYEGSPRNACRMPPKAFDALEMETKRVGVFVDAPPGRIRETVRLYGLDLVQLHGAESPTTCKELRAAGIGVIKAFGIGSAGDVVRTDEYEGSCDLYVFDTRTAAHGGSGRKFDHSLLTGYMGHTSYLLSGGIGPEDGGTLAAWEDPRCAGVDINSRFETAPGVKDPEAIKKFMQTIKIQKR